ncbi:phosphopantetheine-binding protein [Streptomyces sp. PR69]|uniref:phosphopantetheine-binding protein n=1 Tax=Streptomyces sp. PR69 TaxID=2984950 RepID=UPI0022653D29|nr:phosphopantetheine-binding protein [Streptomyces sp. PR69]
MDIEAKVTGYLQQHFGVDAAALRPDATLEELDLDSLALLELLVIVEEETGVPVTDELAGMNTGATLGEAVAQIEKAVAGAAPAGEPTAAGEPGAAPAGEGGAAPGAASGVPAAVPAPGPAVAAGDESGAAAAADVRR